MGRIDISADRSALLQSVGHPVRQGLRESMFTLFRAMGGRRVRATASTRNACAVFAVSGASQQYLECGTMVAISSLRRSNPELPVVILHADLSSQQQRLFKHCDLRKADVNGFRRSARALQERPDLDASVFLRFTIGEITEYDVALYLDSDVVVLDSLQPMIDLEGSWLCRDMKDHPLPDQFVDGMRLLESEGISTVLNAVNAGVMKIDLGFWRSERIDTRVKECVQQHGADAFAYCDQSLINLVGYKSQYVQYLPKTLNYMLWPDMQEARHKIVRNRRGLLAPHTEEGPATIVHWTGPLKPWHEKFVNLTEQERIQYCGPCYEQFITV